jgi:hypothetical protein
MAVTPLPAPPALSGLLDGQPWLISGILLFAAFAVYQLTRRDRLSRTGRLGAAALIVLAVALQALAVGITTPREELARATRQLVHAAATADTAALSSVLAEDARLFSPVSIPGLAIPQQGLDKPGILALVSTAMSGPYALKEHGAREIQAEATSPNTGRTQVQVHAVLDQYGAPGNSWWRIGWRKNSTGQWQATSIEPLELPYRELAG